ncbi:MAG: hypothetical protein SGPRY_014332 [Prymnesium sp.]
MNSCIIQPPTPRRLQLSSVTTEWMQSVVPLYNKTERANGHAIAQREQAVSRAVNLAQKASLGSWDDMLSSVNDDSDVNVAHTNPFNSPDASYAPQKYSGASQSRISSFSRVAASSEG